MEHFDHDVELRLNQIRILYTQSSLALLFPVIAAAALCYILWPVAGHLLLSAWTGIVIVYSITRYFFLKRYSRQPLTRANTGKWLDLFTGSAFVSGMLWGQAAIILVPYEPARLVEFTLYNSLVLIIICGMVAGAVVCYSVCKRVLFFYAVPALAPPAFYLISLGDKYNSSLGGFVLLYLIFVSAFSFRLNSQYLQFIDMKQELCRLGDENDKLREFIS